MPQRKPLPPAPGPTPHEVARLVERACAGEIGAFERLVAEHQAKVYTFAFAFTGDPDRAKDLAQDALVKVYRALRGFRFQSAFSTWLYAIVKNTYLDQIKSRAERQRELEQPLDERQLEKLEAPATAEDGLIQAESRRTLFRALREVPLPFRLVVALADVQGLDYAEIARVLGLPVGTVKSRLARGREALRKALGRLRESWEGSS